MPKGPDSRWIIRKPASRYYFKCVLPQGDIQWTTFDHATRFTKRDTAYAMNEYIDGVVVELNPQTTNYSEEIII